ncbi:MAG: hypothetical protein HOI85_03345 [Euryarchaeota archaeon]|nr:hypothetical protein [Euryarchaeota archaeon]
MRNKIMQSLLLALVMLFALSISETQAKGSELEEMEFSFVDSDDDGYDETDACPDVAGNSTIDRIGCLDSDGDGYSDADDSWNYTDGADVFPQRSDAWSDQDGDMFADQVNLDITDDCPLKFGTSREVLFGCSDMDMDWIPDVLDTDIDGDGISNEMEVAASLVLTYYDPMDPNSVPEDSDFDTLPDAIDDDDDNDGWPDIIEQDRGSDSLDVDKTPFNQYFGINTGFFYQGGFQISSAYDAEAIEISVSGVIEIVTEELVIPFLLIPLYLYFFISKKRRFESLRDEIRCTEDGDKLYSLEQQVNSLVENRKINTLHGLILRNTIEEQENSTRRQKMGLSLEE